MTSFLVDGRVAVDAGAITRALTISEQRRAPCVITHTHMDHTNTLPFLIENSFGSSDQPVSIFCTKRVLAGVRRHLFNNDTWPDFTRIPNHMYPSVKFEEIEIEKPFTIDDLPGGPLEVTAVEVNHIVPTTGLLTPPGPVERDLHLGHRSDLANLGEWPMPPKTWPPSSPRSPSQSDAGRGRCQSPPHTEDPECRARENQARRPCLPLSLQAAIYRGAP